MTIEEKDTMSKLDQSSMCIHAGQHPDPLTGAVTEPINLSSTFAQKSPGVHSGYEYSRSGNPTRNTFETCIASLEHAEFGLAFASGSAATATILHLLKPGDNCISIDDVYGGTNRYFRQIANLNSGVKFDFIDLSNREVFLKAISPETKMVWIETPTNPTLKVTDIRLISDIAHQHDMIVVVDNTFMSPFLQNPMDHGADIVVHSVSKYINGHSDVVMGVLTVTDKSLHTRLVFLQNAIGAVPAPFDCYMALRGVKTLHLRMERHSQNAMLVAKFLEQHNKVERVIYPGLPSHPQHEVARKQARGFGGMVTFFLKGGLKEARIFLESLTLITLAESLGAVESLAEHPGIMTHAAVPEEQRVKLGINDSLVRLSVGVEAAIDILNDLRAAFDAVPHVIDNV